MTDDKAKLFEKLREPFRADQIEKLPKQLKSGRDQDRWQCRAGTQASADGHFCGGYHGRAIHLDYIGHATITERLIEVDPEWTIDFMAKDPATGEPKIDSRGTWFVLTVLGVSRPCVGDTGGKPLDGNGMKELYGDAIESIDWSTGRASFPGANSNVWLSGAHSSTVRNLFLRTSRPATSTPAAAGSC